jgi:hypothetical protein
MLAAIFKHVAKSDFVVWKSKMVEDRVPQSHIHQISKAVKIWRGADDGTVRPQNLPETFKDDVSWYRQVFDHFRKKDEVEFGSERRLGFA